MISVARNMLWEAVMDIFLGNPQLKNREHQFIFVCSEKGFVEETVVQKDGMQVQEGIPNINKGVHEKQGVTGRGTRGQVRMEKTENE